MLTGTGAAGDEGVRALQAAIEGISPLREIIFLGVSYPLAQGSLLAPLMRYAAAGMASPADRARLENLGEREREEDGPDAEARSRAALAATYRLLEDTLAGFPAFAAAAFAAKASPEQIGEAVSQIVAVTTARPYRPGLRLLHYAAGAFAELDGQMLLSSGRGLASLSPREVCNLAYARLLSNVEADRRSEFIEDLYLDYDPEAEALAMMRRTAAERGMGGEPGDDA